MAAKYFIKRGKTVKGPFTVEKLQALKKAKKVKADDEISQSAEGPWDRLGNVYKSILNSRSKVDHYVDDIPALDPNDLPDDPLLDPDLNVEEYYALPEPQAAATSENESPESPPPASSPLPNVASEPPSPKKKKRKKKKKKHLTVDHAGAVGELLSREAALRSSRAFGGGSGFGLLGHILVAVLLTGTVGIICGCFGFIPCLWFSYRNHQRDEPGLALIYAAAAVASIVVGPWLWYVIFGISISSM
jgi:hypothetical protein